MLRPAPGDPPSARQPCRSRRTQAEQARSSFSSIHHPPLEVHPQPPKRRCKNEPAVGLRKMPVFDVNGRTRRASGFRALRGPALLNGERKDKKVRRMRLCAHCSCSKSARPLATSVATRCSIPKPEPRRRGATLSVKDPTQSIGVRLLHRRRNVVSKAGEGLELNRHPAGQSKASAGVPPE
jgi:hypothetical protein